MLHFMDSRSLRRDVFISATSRHSLQLPMSRVQYLPRLHTCTPLQFPKEIALPHGAPQPPTQKRGEDRPSPSPQYPAKQTAAHNSSSARKMHGSSMTTEGSTTVIFSFLVPFCGSQKVKNTAESKIRDSGTIPTWLGHGIDRSTTTTDGKKAKHWPTTPEKKNPPP